MLCYSTNSLSLCYSTTGVRDPVTSTLHIILGSKMSLDIAQVVRWKTSPSSVLESPTLRYAASFAGYDSKISCFDSTNCKTYIWRSTFIFLCRYGFYGEVIKESEKLRWMGPMRYDYAGTMVFLKHKYFSSNLWHSWYDSTFIAIETTPQVP